MPNDRTDLRQDRREWLKTSAAALGASLLPLPAVAAETAQAEFFHEYTAHKCRCST